MTRAVHEAITARPWPACEGESPNRTRDRRTAMRAVLERFVKGHVLRVNADMKEMGTRDLNAAMQGYFSIRSQGPMTETRLMGFFPRHGAFLATAFEGRDRFKTQQDWNDRRAECGVIWNQITASAPYLTTPWPVATRTSLLAYLSPQDA